MTTKNNKTTNLFSRISKEKIDEFEKEYRSMCMSRIQCLEDECSGMIDRFLSENTDYDMDDDDIYFDIVEIYSEFNSKNLFGIKDEIKMSEIINNNN
jgi:hypothetical protein